MIILQLLQMTNQMTDYEAAFQGFLSVNRSIPTTTLWNYYV